jgi:glycosyltransferase involved in cell wall biosynthesis
MAKILFLCDRFYPEIGGIETVSEILASEFAASSHEVHMITWSRPTGERSFGFRVGRGPTILRLLREFKWADVIFENNPCLKLSWPNFFYRKPWVIAVHTWISRTNGRVSARDRLKLRWLRAADKVITPSEAVKLKSKKDAVVIGNPYNHELFRDLDIPRNKDYVYLGRLVSDKGVDILIDGFHKLTESLADRDERRALTLTIIGEGPERLKLEDQVDRLNLQSRVVFLGPVSGEVLARVLNQHKYIVIPSRWEEPFGLVVLEGMACGCLPIAARSGGLPDAVGSAGVIFEKGDVSSLEQAMAELLDNPSYESDIRKNAESHLQKHRSTVVAQEYLRIICGALTESGREATRLNPFE